MKNKIIPSQQTQQEATSIAKATQKQGQVKRTDQTDHARD
ncbi:hypothetical protein VIBRN418_13541 [Vibrio sp. N418]|nr:hypothetical protein VIBRN418_13541 [Vibrio sp. N418]